MLSIYKNYGKGCGGSRNSDIEISLHQKYNKAQKNNKFTLTFDTTTE